MRFFIRRGLKIWPSYYLLVLMAILLVAVRTHGQLGTAFWTMLPNLLHIQNYWPGERPLGQTWSLAVEEHFYLALPFFLGIGMELPDVGGEAGRDAGDGEGEEEGAEHGWRVVGEPAWWQGGQLILIFFIFIFIPTSLLSLLLPD